MRAEWEGMLFMLFNGTICCFIIVFVDVNHDVNRYRLYIQGYLQAKICIRGRWSISAINMVQIPSQELRIGMRQAMTVGNLNKAVIQHYI